MPSSTMPTKTDVFKKGVHVIVDVFIKQFIISTIVIVIVVYDF